MKRRRTPRDPAELFMQAATVIFLATISAILIAGPYFINGA